MQDSNNFGTALITGASSGIGWATALTLNEAGYNTILVARRESKLIELQTQLRPNSSHLIALDINDREAISEAIEALPAEFRDIDVLVNNAGLALGLEPIHETKWDDWQTMIETNCMALAFLSRTIVPSMVERNFGTIINIGSTAGTYAYRGSNVYGASKAFVHHFSQSLRSDLLGTQVRVSCIQPGLLGESEFSMVRFEGDKERADPFYHNCQPLVPADIAETVRWILAQPQHVNINELEIMPNCQSQHGLAVHRE